MSKNPSNIPITGVAGAVPPPHAPRETTQPLSDAEVQRQLQAARANERELQPLVFTPTPPIPSTTVKPTPIEKAPRGEQATSLVGAAQPEPEFFDQPVKSHQPAASETESPSRGMPREVADQGKQITGGFGDVGELQYFPLDGMELRELVATLLAEVAERMMDDLRFSIAVTYPRVTARVEVHIEGFAEDQGFMIRKVMPAHEKTPIEVAQRFGDEVVFIVKAERREMTPEGESVTPPNKMRQEMGLAIPHKRSVETPSGRVMVDVVP